MWGHPSLSSPPARDRNTPHYPAASASWSTLLSKTPRHRLSPSSSIGMAERSERVCAIPGCCPTHIARRMHLLLEPSLKPRLGSWTLVLDTAAAFTECSKDGLHRLE